MAVFDAAWNSATALGPSMLVGATSLSLTLPSSSAAALAPNAISWNGFWSVAA